MGATGKKAMDEIRDVSESIFRVSPLLKRQIGHMPVFQSDDGLPQSLYQVLSLLNERESMSVSEISRYFGIAKPNITPLVDRLVGDGLVERVRSTSDRRVVFIRIMPEGRSRLKRIQTQLAEHISVWREKLGEEDFQRLAVDLNDICSILDRL